MPLLAGAAVDGPLVEQGAGGGGVAGDFDHADAIDPGDGVVADRVAGDDELLVAAASVVRLVDAGAIAGRLVVDIQGVHSRGDGGVSAVRHAGCAAAQGRTGRTGTRGCIRRGRDGADTPRTRRAQARRAGAEQPRNRPAASPERVHGPPAPWPTPFARPTSPHAPPPRPGARAPAWSEPGPIGYLLWSPAASAARQCGDLHLELPRGN